MLDNYANFLLANCYFRYCHAIYCSTIINLAFNNWNRINTTRKNIDRLDCSKRYRCLNCCWVFASILTEEGYQDADILTALTFALVFITVCVHGFTLGPLAKKLGLSNQESEGVVIVGGSSFAIALADKLKELDYPVLITDSSRGRLRSATQKGINTHHG